MIMTDTVATPARPALRPATRDPKISDELLDQDDDVGDGRVTQGLDL